MNLVTVLEQHSVQKIFFSIKLLPIWGRVRWWDRCRRL